MDREAIVTGLEDAGLSAYEAEAYLTLLDQGTSKAVDVAKHSSIPVPRIYDVVKELERRGYVETLERDTLHVRAHEPVDVIGDLHDQSARLSDVADAIEERWEHTPVAEHEVNVTKRARTAIEHAEAAIRDADTTVEIAPSGDLLARFEESLVSAAENGAVVRVSLFPGDEVGATGDIGGDAVEADGGAADLEAGSERPPADPGAPGEDHPTAGPVSTSLEEAVTEVRERTFDAPLLVIVDGETACYAPTTDMPDPFGVIVEGDYLALLFRWYFQTALWGPWPPAAGDLGWSPIYVSLEEFVSDVYDLWTDGARVRLRVEGVDTDTGEPGSVEGELVDVRFTGQDRLDRAPTITELGGEATIVVDDGDRRCSVGGWCAQVEDLEVLRIELLEPTLEE